LKKYIYLIALLSLPAFSGVTIHAIFTLLVLLLCRTEARDAIAQGVNLAVQVVPILLLNEVVCVLGLEAGRLGSGIPGLMFSRPRRRPLYSRVVLNVPR